MSYQPKRRWWCFTAATDLDEWAVGHKARCRFSREHSVACGWKVLIDADSWHPDKKEFLPEDALVVERRVCDEKSAHLCNSAHLTDAYRQGVIDGKTEGYDEGYRQGYDHGYQQGDTDNAVIAAKQPFHRAVQYLNEHGISAVAWQPGDNTNPDQVGEPG